MKRCFLLACTILMTILLSAFPANIKSVFASTPRSIQGLHVSGNRIVNADGEPIRLLGVNRSGGEYMCIQGRGIWEGPADSASVEAIVAWGTNAIRIPLNEHCWLGINGVKTAFSGENYKRAIVEFVNLVNSHGLVAILDLHWSAPGTTPATELHPMPDMDHAPAFWRSVATVFKDNSSVIFDLFNEPFPANNGDTTAGWKCWRDGGDCPGIDYEVAGMQLLVDTVRAAGAANILMLGGLQYSNALSQWLDYKPHDPLDNLAASWHSYNFNLCSNVICWEQRLVPVIEQVPVVAGEIGQNDCDHAYIDQLMMWLDAHDTGYLAWTWDAWAGMCADGPVLITDYKGTPTKYGQGFRDHLLSLQANAE